MNVRSHPLMNFKTEPLAHKAEHRRLFGFEPGELVAQLGLNLALDVFKKLSIEIGIQHFRMNIAFSAATRSIALLTFFLARTWESKLSNSERAMAASTVPAQVRKSLAVMSMPVISRR
jgi:hypothetical protein